MVFQCNSWFLKANLLSLLPACLDIKAYTSCVFLNSQQVAVLARKSSFHAQDILLNRFWTRVVCFNCNCCYCCWCISSPWSLQVPAVTSSEMVQISAFLTCHINNYHLLSKKYWHHERSSWIFWNPHDMRDKPNDSQTGIPWIDGERVIRKGKRKKTHCPVNSYQWNESDSHMLLRISLQKKHWWYYSRNSCQKSWWSPIFWNCSKEFRSIKLISCDPYWGQQY